MQITQIETVVASDIMPGLLMVRVHTDDGYVGCGETYYAPQAVAAMIHDWMSRYLLGKNPLAIESHWRFLYERATNFGSRGAELRAISAIDLALWDIFGQLSGQPIWQLLGGAVQESVRTYNSCGGPSYGGKINTGNVAQGWPGYGIVGNEGPLNDYWSIIHRPVELAEELLAEGYQALKCWTFDFAAHRQNGPLHITHADITKALTPFKKIRESLGSQIELIIDGHGFFQLPAAVRIAKRLQEYDILWAEDLMRVDAVDTLSDFRKQVEIPVAVSEMFSGPDDFRLTLEKRAADFIMIDPTWVGGVSQTVNITRLAQFYNVPVVMHDCTGPLTLLTGLHVAVASANVAWQESLRAHLRLLYPQLIDRNLEVNQGRIAPPQSPGIGVAWQEELFNTQSPAYRSSVHNQ